mmetsp:Transcript_81381/g.226663  ORF Transcript_81381/g.226663 Transcript_81381/m.226663 type:complete len:414 (-) Transcript_81381:104-1345(-)
MSRESATQLLQAKANRCPLGLPQDPSGAYTSSARHPVCHFWEGQNYRELSEFLIDCKDFQGHDSKKIDVNDAQLQRLIEATMTEKGLVHLVNTGLTDVHEMRKLCDPVLGRGMAYEGGAGNRTAFMENVYDVAAPAETMLMYHHEMAYNAFSPKHVAFGCIANSDVRTGHTFVADNLAVHREIMDSPWGEKLKRVGVCYHRYLTDQVFYDKIGGVDWRGLVDMADGGRVTEEEIETSKHIFYNHWQKSFNAETMEEAEANAKAAGLSVEWTADPRYPTLNKRFMRTKIYMGAFEYFPDMGKNLLYTTPADHNMWFDMWPGLKYFDQSHRPFQMTFGDDSLFSEEFLAFFCSTLDKYGIRVPWRVGDVSMMCNYRWVHGRPGFCKKPGEERELAVMLGERFYREGASSECSYEL